MADRVQPRLGVEKAVESLLQLLPSEQAELIVISGPAPEGVAYAVTTMRKPPGWRGRLVAIPELRRSAKARAAAGDTIVAAGSWAFIALAVATVFTRFKITLWEHSILSWRIRHERRLAIVALALRVLSFRIERIVCVSDANRSALARLVWPVKDLRVIPNAIQEGDDAATSDERPIQGESPDVVKLFGVGSLIHLKNWELAIRAMELLPENFRLDIAGQGDQYDTLSTLIDDLGLTSRVRLLGYVPNADRLMSEADVIVHPSFAETFGYVMVEAAARRRPVVTLDMPVMNEMVPRFAPGELASNSPEGFAEAILAASSADYSYDESNHRRNESFGDSAVRAEWSHLIGRTG